MITVSELLQAVARLGPTGKIWATSITPPSERYATSAAKIVYFKRGQAENPFAKVRGGQLFVGGLQATVMWNKLRSAEEDDGPDHRQSRVLIITGPSLTVNHRGPLAVLARHIKYDIDDILELRRVGYGPEQINSMEFRFGSFRAQACAAKRFLHLEFPDIEVEYGHDPCDF